MEQFSPFTRKLVALGLLFLVVLSTINLGLLPLFTSIGSKLAELDEARLRRARLEAIEAAPITPNLAPPAPALTFRAANLAQADTLFGETLRQASIRNGVTLDVAPTAGSQPNMLAATISATGPELQLLAFINELETGSPVVRLIGWKITTSTPAPAPAPEPALPPVANSGPSPMPMQDLVAVPAAAAAAPQAATLQLQATAAAVWRTP